SDAVIAANRFGSWGIDTAGMDSDVRPGQDFFAYVSGKWAADTEIPADKSMYGSFLGLRDLSDQRVHQLLESYPLADTATGGDAAKLAALYQGYLDEKTVEALDAKPLQPYLDAIRAAADKDGIARLMGQSSASLGRSFFGS